MDSTLFAIIIYVTGLGIGFLWGYEKRKEEEENK